MEFFSKAKAVRLKSHLNKYLVADDDQVSTRQSRHGTTRRARWLVELVDTNEHVVRLKSCHNRYLTASDEPFLLGMTGHKVTQATPDSDDNIKDLSIEWQPIRDGFLVSVRCFIMCPYLHRNFVFMCDFTWLSRLLFTFLCL